jgi:hypothetical protein
MGDTVNLASRLEGQTKAYGLSIIIGSRTAAAVADEFALLEIDSIRVKGKTEPEVIYTIHGRADLKETPAFKALQQGVGEPARVLPEAGLGPRAENAGGMPFLLRWPASGRPA